MESLNVLNQHIEKQLKKCDVESNLFFFIPTHIKYFSKINNIKKIHIKVQFKMNSCISVSHYNI